jgi:DNA-binding PadR family transcriptional regulator
VVGRFAEAAVWILVVLRGGAVASAALLTEIRRLDGPIGEGTFFGALTRLERAGLVERTVTGGLPLYRLAEYSRRVI